MYRKTYLLTCKLHHVINSMGKGWCLAHLRVEFEGLREIFIGIVLMKFPSNTHECRSNLEFCSKKTYSRFSDIKFNNRCLNVNYTMDFTKISKFASFMYIFSWDMPVERDDFTGLSCINFYALLKLLALEIIC